MTVSVGSSCVLFGLIGLSRLPYQLTPSVEEPEISVTTPGRVRTERGGAEIIDEQERR